MKKQVELDLAEAGIDAIINLLNKKYGQGTLIRADQAEGLQIKYISTGAYALDFAMGGGIPENYVTEFRGPFSSLKSTMALFAIKKFQKKYPEGLAIYLDPEHSLNPQYAKRLGVNNARLLIITPDSGEQACDLIKEVLEIRFPLFTVIDSIAALVPTGELEQSADQQFMGLQARLINRMMRVTIARMKRSLYDRTQPTSTILALNQLREKVGILFGSPETTPGGRGKDFFYGMIVHLSSTISMALKKEVLQYGTKHQVRFGQRVAYKVLKNKCGGTQFEEGEFSFYVRPYKGHLPYTFNNNESLAHFGIFYGVVEQIDNKYEFRSLVAPNEQEFAELLEEKASEEQKAFLYQEILKAINQSIYGEELVKVRVVTSRQLKLCES
jgi:recombination protein RecA